MTILTVILSILALSMGTALYLMRVNRMMLKQPPEALAMSPERWTDEKILEEYKKCVDEPINIAEHLPPKTGNRYVVVGGSGFVGGWIILHLLARGEQASHIRIFDIRPPERCDLLTGPAKKVLFFPVDITNPADLQSAFEAPWPINKNKASLPPLTVIHTAAVLRFYEHHNFLLERSTRINVTGTQNVIDAACAAGASYLIATSSIAVLAQRVDYWVLPWKTYPKNFVQVLGDDGPRTTAANRISNYAWTKAQGERLVSHADGRETNRPKGVLRTGSVRAGAMVHGPGGDVAMELGLKRKGNPSWLHDMLQSHVYVENVSLAHLAFEAALMAPDVKVGGKAFLVTDPKPLVSFGDLYRSLTVLTNGTVTFPRVSPVMIYFVAWMIEIYYTPREYLLKNSPPFVRSIVSALFPPVGAEVLTLQTATMQACLLHLAIDDSQARRSIEAGGIGYKPPFTTIQGICKLVQGFDERERLDKELQRSGRK